MGTTMTATMVYLKDSQRKRLKQLARTKKTSLAEELRNAVEQYLNSGQVDVTAEELSMLVAEASAGVKGMIAEIDSALRYAEAVFRQMEEREHGRKRHN